LSFLAHFKLKRAFNQAEFRGVKVYNENQRECY